MKKLLSKMKIFHLILLVLSGALIIAALPFKTQYNYIFVNVSTTVEAATKETLDDLENKQEYLFALFNMGGYDTNADGSVKAVSQSALITEEGEYTYSSISLDYDLDAYKYFIPANAYTRNEDVLVKASPITYSAYRRVTVNTAADFDSANTYYVIEGSSYVVVTDTTKVSASAYYVKDTFLVWEANTDYFTKNADGSYTQVTLGDYASIHKVGDTDIEEYYTYSYDLATKGEEAKYNYAGTGGENGFTFKDSTIYFEKVGDSYIITELTDGVQNGVDYYEQETYYTQISNVEYTLKSGLKSFEEGVTYYIWNGTAYETVDTTTAAFDESVDYYVKNSAKTKISILAPLTIGNYNRATDFEYNAGSFDTYKKQVYDFQIQLNDVNDLILWFGIVSLIGVAFLYFFANNSRRIYYKSNIIVSAIYTIVMVVMGVILLVQILNVMSTFSADSDLYNYVSVMQNTDINIEIYRDILGSKNPSAAAIHEYFSCNVATFIGYIFITVITLAYVVFVFVLSLLKYKDTAERRKELEKVVAAND